MSRRLHVPLTPETWKALDDYVAVSDDTKAKICSMFLHASIPALEAMTRTMAASQNRAETASREFSSLLSSALGDANQLDNDLKEEANKAQSDD